MRDRIIAAFLKDFVAEFGLSDLDESDAFEDFTNYCIISKHHPDEFDPEDVATGGFGDLGLDGLGVLVNDHLVFSEEDVDHLKKSLRRLDVDFIFVQAKTSPHFSGADIGTFISGVRRFLDKEAPAAANETILALHRLKEHIFDSSIDMERSPICHLYYATTGSWKEDQALQAVIDQGVRDIQLTGLFSSVDFHPIDSESLQRIYRELHNKIVREMVFEKHTILPTISGVPEAYIGIVPCEEYLKLICDDDGLLNRRLFYDNVRDFQGNNPVNLEIEQTLLDVSRNDRFALLNNGVTIVASEINKVGANFKLKDFQIVNGCQTSHILYRNRSQLTPTVFLPIKLIVTTDADVTNQVIQGTNRQTEVKLEAFESLAPFQKTLEELYNAMGRDAREPLLYERRSKQYEHLGLRREQIVTLAAQIKCFVATFLNEPQSTHRYYGELLTSYRPRLFNESHSPLPYFVSGAWLAALENLFNRGILPRKWRPWKYQLLMVIRLQNQPSELPPLNSKTIEKYCDVLLEILRDDSKVHLAATRAGQLVEDVRTRMEKQSREPLERTRAFTTALIDAAGGGRNNSARTNQLTGTVNWFSDVKGYGFIDIDDGTQAFVHYTGIISPGYRALLQGQRVRFVPVEKPKGIQPLMSKSLAEISPRLIPQRCR
jgi:cold shock CspA family protein